MTKANYSVTIVLDPEYGDRLLSIPPDVPVWIVDTPVNRAAAQQARLQRGTGSHLHGVTTFDFRATDSAEETLIAELGTIDLHHGPYSSETPYTTLDVIGAPLSDRIKAEMGDYGLDKFQPTALGFRALRSVPLDRSE